MEEKPAKPKRVGNHYIPPPARKQGAELQDFSRVKERPNKLSGQRQEKLCDDSSLLFKDSSPKLEEKTKVKRKSKRSNKKANAENTSVPIAAETQPVLPSYVDGEKGIYQHSIPQDTCEVSDKVLVKSHLPLNDLENTRTGKTNNLETLVKLIDNDPDNSRRMLVIPCSFTRCLEGEVKANDMIGAGMRTDANENPGLLSEAARDSLPNRVVSESEHTTMNGVLEPQREETCENSEGVSFKSYTVDTKYSDLVDICANDQPVIVCNDLSCEDEPKSQSKLSDITDCSLLMNNLSGSETSSGSVVLGRTRDPNAKVIPPSDGSMELVSIEDDDWDSIYDDSGDCLIPQSACSLPKESRSEVENDLAKMKISPKQSVPEKTYDNCSSIIEIYGFSEDLKTNDLLSVFGSFISRGFNLKWVDNTHALGIFPSPLLAEEALSSNLPLVKTRPIALGTPLSQEKSRTLVLPSSLRPKTCSALARRLVSGALGLRVKATPEERAAERELLREAREKKKLVLKQRDAAWEGTFSSLDGCEDKEST